MAKLIYSMITSLDGYAEAADGDLGTGPADDQEVHTFINDLFRPVGTYLYGRRMYETMVYWETAHTEPDQPPHIAACQSRAYCRKRLDGSCRCPVAFQGRHP
nr:dihydrofolate reductase family protein [Streptomyces carpinensis]